MEKEVKKEEQAKPNKLNYEQVVRIVNELQVQGQRLFNENKQLRKQIETYEQADYWQRIEWLWRVITEPIKYIPEHFVKEKAKEFMELMTPVQTDKEENKGETKESTDKK